MKKTFFLAVIICFSQITQAQVPSNMDTLPTVSADTALNKLKATADHKQNYITVQAGQVMLVTNGKGKKLDKDKTLKNGTTVMMDGSVKAMDGAIIKLSEGEKIYLDGNKEKTE